MAATSTSSAVALCREHIVRTERTPGRTEWVLASGSMAVASTLLASVVIAGDEISFPIPKQDFRAGTEILVGRGSPRPRRPDLYQAAIGYVSEPKEEDRGGCFVNAEVFRPQLGITNIRIPCEVLRDYFFVADRSRPWERQRSFYDVLGARPPDPLIDLRLAFKLRQLELRTSHAAKEDLRVLERAFNILADERARACYDALLQDCLAPAIFPYGGFGSILVAGQGARTGHSFRANRILSFEPEHYHRRFRAPLRHFQFYDGRALYRDSRRKLEVWLDPVVLPNLIWDATWNRWKHLLGTKIEIGATFVQNGSYRRRGDQWELVRWETALPSRVEAKLPAELHSQIEFARKTFHRFGEYSDALEKLRATIQLAPIEKARLQNACKESGVPSDFDVVLLNWRPDYEPFFYQQLLQRARTLYLFREEYIFDLERAVVVERPQLGNATYIFAKPANMALFLADYTRATKEDIRTNRLNVAGRLGFVGRLMHGTDPRAWLKEMKRRIGEAQGSSDAGT
jgi:curved DNA-binding protein CbpA